MIITAVFWVSLLHPPGSEVYLRRILWPMVRSGSCDKLTSRKLVLRDQEHNLTVIGRS